MRSRDRGATLVLGLLPDVYKWVDFGVKHRIREWAEELGDVDLVKAASRLDKKTKGIPTDGAFARRVRMREALHERLGQGGLAHDQAHQDLVNLIEEGFSTYAVRKQP